MGKNHHSATASFLLAKFIFSIHLSYAFLNSLYPALLFKWFTKRSNTAQQQCLYKLFWQTRRRYCNNLEIMTNLVL